MKKRSMLFLCLAMAMLITACGGERRTPQLETEVIQETQEEVQKEEAVSEESLVKEEETKREELSQLEEKGGEPLIDRNAEGASGEEEQAAEIDTAEEENESIKESEEIQEAENSDISSGEVNPDLKAFLDEYEAFMDEYVEFMKRYKDSGNSMEMLSDYLKMMERYADFAQAAEQYNADEMSAADAAYYLDVMSRVSKKMLEAAY